MRGIVHTLSRRPAAWALIAGVAILAGAFAPAAFAQAPGSGSGLVTGADVSRAEEMAFALPRVPGKAGNIEVALPQPLTPSDVARIRQALVLQRRGNFAGATAVVQTIDDQLLTGYILADRYLGRGYRTSAAELAAWLRQYPDLPDEPAVRALLQRRDPAVAASLPILSPAAARIPPVPPMRTEPDAVDTDIPRSRGLDQAVQQRALAGRSMEALRLIASARGLSATCAALLRAEVAQILFTQNQDTEALRVVLISLLGTPTQAQPGLTAYIGGLAAWRLGRPDQARILFEESTRAGFASGSQRAASAFWAARASRRLGDAAAWVRWLHLATAHQGTLHGLLARRILGLPTGIVPTGELVGASDMDAVADTPQGWRAFALLQVGETERATAELRGLWASADQALRRSILVVTSGCGLTELAVDFASMRQAGGPAGVLPMPRLRPDGGFSIDPALVYALTLTESNFDTQAISAAGARGLMQIMPVTAQFIARNGSLAGHQLHDAGLNLALGQRYVWLLSSVDGVGNDLLRVLASYNAGPGNVLRWNTTLHDDGDPLLLMEAIPFAETRAFVPRVLTYSWMYAARLHVPAPSLDTLAAGEFPRFTWSTPKRTLVSTPAASR